MHAYGHMECVPISRSVEESSSASNLSLHLFLNPSMRNLDVSFPSTEQSESLTLKIQEKYNDYNTIFSKSSNITLCYLLSHLSGSFPLTFPVL